MKDFDIRSMFQELGARPGLIPMGIQFSFLLPRSSDPQAPGIIFIVQSLQNGLIKKGYPVELDGITGPQTQRVLEMVSGPRWQQKTWIQIMGDVINARRYSANNGLGNYFEVGAMEDTAKNPLVWLAAGVAGMWLYMKKVKK